ncbi:unnamed protein product [Rotaria magnacalcarata]|uniref:Tetratricopeptide repeat protein n=1 Tax=Rotaria magnacalcarata TaxID=392030 RepID=A0A815QFK3_9BILA|nr:unnamed protein product [Rotaria magnacalcarata]CAF1628591.1 unnamed protein product [Rotaria magnacalcarata]CAF3843597.1 unnamed protein product [Rotaria magnacalcarata]CAF3852640.1 unnamed protein product [Rotaria magnacalcarata]
MGFFIRHLHRQLEQLHIEQSDAFKEKFTVYRGQGLSQEDFQNLGDTKGGLLSFNNFLSTSKERKVAMEFVQRTINISEDIVGVIFIMTIDQSKISTSITPFPMIDDYTAIRGEQEILFTMHTILRVAEIKQAAENNRVWEVQLAITGDNDPQLSVLTRRMKEETPGQGWHRMSQYMLRVGRLDQAEELYNELLKNASSDSYTVYIYHEFGRLKSNQGKYQEAVTFYEKSLALNKKTLPENDFSLASTYGNVGGLYDDMGDYSKELEFYKKSHKILEISLPQNHPTLAVSYHNIGLVYNNMGDYTKAFEFYEKSLKILEISLPQNHPELATSYCSIGLVYDNIGEYSKALEFYEKDLKIMKISLPSNHPDFAASYNNIGVLYEHMGEYSKALSYLEKAVTILRKSLPFTHPKFKMTINSIDRVKEKL